ncbi:MAG: heat-inducible transcriptional repressor HrcA [Nitrospirota bacterium]
MQTLDERTKKVLFAVVESYINFHGPVGSRFVTKRYSLGFSPATIRNIMADLEDMGLLIQPHTSAGRMPTDRGYRIYVNSLVSEGYHYNRVILDEIYKRLEILKDNIELMLSEIPKSLSMLTSYLGVAMSPKPNMTTLKRIELLKFKTDKVAVIIFTDEGIIKNKIINLDSDIAQKDLNRIAGYLNSEFSGLTFDEIRLRILEEIAEEKTKYSSLIFKAIRICREALCFIQSDLFVSGLSEVLELPDFADLRKIKELSRAIEDKHTIIKLLDKISNAEGVQIIIGSENSMDEMKRLSMVASACKDENNHSVAVVGIIGPTRMDYEKAIWLVDNTAKFVTKMLAK